MTENRPHLIVEGLDDKNVVIHLLKRHGYDFDYRMSYPNLPEVDVVYGVEKLLNGLPAKVKSVRATIGFVLDADANLEARWQAVRNKLKEAGVSAPEELPESGFVGFSETVQVKVGVWIMPDNRNPGYLEDFLRSMLDESNPLLKHAEESTKAAKEQYAAPFRDVQRTKAVIPAFLAWQDEPGRPFGTAIQNLYFDPKSRLAAAFALWFSDVFGSPQPIQETSA